MWRVDWGVRDELVARWRRCGSIEEGFIVLGGVQDFLELGVMLWSGHGHDSRSPGMMIVDRV